MKNVKMIMLCAIMYFALAVVVPYTAKAICAEGYGVVKYEYEGIIPKNAPEPPNAKYYGSESCGHFSDSVADVPTLDGYLFSGWVTDDVNVTDGQFSVSNYGSVTFKGHWDKLYNVEYRIEGDIPEGYLPPELKQYIKDSQVDLSHLKKGDVMNGYRFLGWDIQNVEYNDDNFKMPDKDVIVIGRFEKIETDDIDSKTDSKYNVDEVEGSDNPNTFDNIYFYESLFVISLVLSILLYRKVIKR